MTLEPLAINVPPTPERRWLGNASAVLLTSHDLSVSSSSPVESTARGERKKHNPSGNVEGGTQRSMCLMGGEKAGAGFTGRTRPLGDGQGEQG